MDEKYRIRRGFKISIQEHYLLPKFDDYEPDVYEWSTVGMLDKKDGEKMSDDELIADFLSGSKKWSR